MCTEASNKLGFPLPSRHHVCAVPDPRRPRHLASLRDQEAGEESSGAMVSAASNRTLALVHRRQDKRISETEGQASRLT